MENNHLSELTIEDIIKASGGTLDETNKRSMDLMIRLFKAQGRKIEEIYQIPGLPDEMREYYRSRWYQL